MPHMFMKLRMASNTAYLLTLCHHDASSPPRCLAPGTWLINNQTLGCDWHCVGWNRGTGRAQCSTNITSHAHHTLSVELKLVCYMCLCHLVSKTLITNDVSIYLMSSQRKQNPPERKTVDEGRMLNEKWTGEYFIKKTNHMALCLFCKEIVSVLQYYHLERHLMQKHAAKFNAYQRVFHKDR